MTNPFLFDLANSVPLITKPEGTVQGAYKDNFPVVKHRKGAMFLVVLAPQGVREPHWHPDAWEFDYCISGRARMAVVAPNNQWQIFEVTPGQAVFVPQGYFHYFENIGTEPLRFLVAFNSSEAEHDDDIGISLSRTGLPDEVLAKTFGVPAEVFARIPRPQQEPVIV
jgi:oxalate decarboxylase